MNMRTRTDALLLVAFCGFLFFYGLGSFGLLGADEPRYAQVAREMLERHDWVTPTLQGKPWLEKPPLYYWQAIVAYRAERALIPASDGVTDGAARVPSAIDAALMIAVIYFFLRRFRPGSEIDGALITAGCAATIGFARAAATDMPLAATFTIAMLAWYAWHETGKRIQLAAFYLFLALGTLAKGPIAPFLAAVILTIFAGLKRDWRTLVRTLWIPGILVFLAVALPWYVAVQVRNPEFFRVFILQHNLGRFGTDLYHHRAPFWYYLPVLLLSLAPWTVWAVAAAVECLRDFSWSSSERSQDRPDQNSWQLFLLIWLLISALFFSLSQSKLPGYVLPGIPAGALLVTGYLARRREKQSKLPVSLVFLHAALSGTVIFVALAAPAYILNHRVTWDRGTALAVAIAIAAALGVAATLLLRSGFRLVRVVTMIPIVIAVAAILKLDSPTIDATLSMRLIAQTIGSFSQEPVPVALFQVSREQQYGLEFYLNREVTPYEQHAIPSEGHVLVAAHNTIAQAKRLSGRRISYLTSIPSQKLDVYWIASAPTSQP